jgi:hypothetical protein
LGLSRLASDDAVLEFEVEFLDMPHVTVHTSVLREELFTNLVDLRRRSDLS